MCVFLSLPETLPDHFIAARNDSHAVLLSLCECSQRSRRAVERYLAARRTAFPHTTHTRHLERILIRKVCFSATSKVPFLRLLMSLSVSDCCIQREHCLLPPWPVFFFLSQSIYSIKMNFNSLSPSNLNRNIRSISTVFTVFVKGFAITFTHTAHFQWPSWIKPPPGWRIC